MAAGDPGPINPALTSSGQTHPVTGQVFNGLVRLTCTQPAGTRCNYEPLPDLAESWTISPDGKTYVFNLRQGVRWHDGRPFTSADVKYTFEQVLLTRHPRTRTLNGRVIAGIDAPTANQVVFRLNQPYSPLLLFLDEDNGGILPRHLFEGSDPSTNPRNCARVEICEPPIGTGPFRFDSRTPEGITLVRNDDYFEPGRPYLDGIVFRFLGGAQATAAFEREEVDLVNPDPREVDRLRDERGATITEEGREGFARVVRLIPNLRPCTDEKAPPVCERTGGRNPFADERVRKAIAYAIDRDEIARVQYGGLQFPATGPLTRFLAPFYNPNTQPQYTRDVAEANRRLDAAGFARGEGGVRFRITFIHDPGFAQAAAALRRQLAEVGIDFVLDSKDFNSWVRQLYIDRNFDIGYSNITDPADPEIGLRRTVTCDNRTPPSPPIPFNNGAGYCNPGVDDLFNRAAQESNETARANLYFEIQNVLADEQPNFYLVDGIGPYAYYDKRFRGFEAAAPKTPYYFGRTVFAVRSAANPPASQPPAPESPSPSPSPGRAGCERFTAKMSLSRARIDQDAGVVDILAPITRRASGAVEIEVHAAGRRVRFDAPIDSANGRVAVRRKIPSAQVRQGTAIVTIRYGGDADTRSQVVRLRAARRQADLQLARPRIDGRFLAASGSVADRARGVVRVQLEYVYEGQTVTLERSATINRRGRWTLNAQLSEGILSQIAHRCGTLHSYTQFTGDFPRRIRGEMRSFRVLGDR